MDREERLGVFGSLVPGQKITVETADGDRVEGAFSSFAVDCLVLDMGVYDRLLFGDEVARVVVVADAPLSSAESDSPE